MISQLRYLWRRWRRRCYECGKPPRHPQSVLCQACFERICEESRWRLRFLGP